ncbi:MAG: cytochrome c-type biogenesis protein CcmH [Acidimicrobiia bacterium]
MRKWWPWLMLGALVVVTILVASWPSGGTRSAAARARSLAAELRCVDCESLSVAESGTVSARAIRADIRRRVDHGESDADIRAYYVGQYGESILLKPASSGIGAFVWILPVLVLVAGGGTLFVALRRWQQAPRLHASDEDRDLVERAREQEGSG